MSDNKCLLHISKLDEFKNWLTNNDIPFRPGKGHYQVIQVMTKGDGWQVVFRKNEMPEHFSINHRLMPTVRKFIRESK